jgi:hypothetical protein
MKAGWAALAAVVALVMASAAGSAARAQSGANALPPAPRTTDRPPVVLHYAVAFLLAGGVVALSIMPSKRGHQD